MVKVLPVPVAPSRTCRARPPARPAPAAISVGWSPGGESSHEGGAALSLAPAGADGQDRRIVLLWPANLCTARPPRWRRKRRVQAKGRPYGGPAWSLGALSSSGPPNAAAMRSPRCPLAGASRRSRMISQPRRRHPDRCHHHAGQELFDSTAPDSYMVSGQVAGCIPLAECSPVPSRRQVAAPRFKSGLQARFRGCDGVLRRGHVPSPIPMIVHDARGVR